MIRRKRRQDAPYHHGALPEALLDAAEAILARDGIQAVTLRAVARAAGVSHAAPGHHFQDLTGLLSALAAVGYRRFARDLTEAVQAVHGDGRDRMIAMGFAYVQFAVRYPGMFSLMFRGEQLDRTRPALQEASSAAFGVLRAGVRARTDIVPVDPMAEAIAAWSLVHGFACLLIDRQLPRDRSWEDLLRAVMETRRPC